MKTNCNCPKHIIYKRFMFRYKNYELQIALKYDKNNDKINLPCRYEQKGEKFKESCEGELIKEVNADDYELWMLKVENVHPGKHAIWTDVLKMNNMNVSLDIQKEIFSVILDHFTKIGFQITFDHPENEAFLNSYKIYFDGYKNIMYNIAKNDYLKKLQYYIDKNGKQENKWYGHHQIEPMNIDLLKREMTELKYFHPVATKNPNNKEPYIEYNYGFNGEWFGAKYSEETYHRYFGRHFPTRIIEIGD